MVKCVDGLQCIPEWYMCDGEQDCLDGSDEDETICKGLLVIVKFESFSFRPRASTSRILKYDTNFLEGSIPNPHALGV